MVNFSIVMLVYQRVNHLEITMIFFSTWLPGPGGCVDDFEGTSGHGGTQHAGASHASHRNAAQRAARSVKRHGD